MSLLGSSPREQVASRRGQRGTESRSASPPKDLRHPYTRTRSVGLRDRQSSSGSSFEAGSVQQGPSRLSRKSSSCRSLPSPSDSKTSGACLQKELLPWRSPQVKAKSPTVLVLNRRHLKQCPLIAGEEETLKILRCRQNHIAEIEYLSPLTNLCILDMCDNELRTTSGLQGLRSLRVLLLSGNRIEELSGLETLTSLEILSASNNLIKSARGLEGLKELCILNLSSNQVICLGSELNQLTQLTELYVEKNKVTSIDCLQELPNLKKLFLSNNFIKSLDDAANLMSCASLLQLSLKGCPVTRLQGYRQALLTGLPQLKYLDYSFITEEERRRARLSWQRETRRRRRLTQLRRHGALLDAAITSSRLLWECPDPQVSLSTLKEKTFIMLPASQHGSSEDESSSASLSTCGALDDAYCQAAELKDVTVEIYGPGAIAKLLCQSLCQRSVASITVLKLHYVCFQEVFPDLVQLRKKFPGINCLYLRCCRVDKLCHLKMLSRLQGLKSITVEDAGNRVTLLSVWKPYFIFCLGDDVETLNSSPITLVEKLKADLLFRGITKFTELGSDLRSLDQCADTSSFQVKPEGNPESLPSQIVQDAFRRAEKQQMLRMSCHRVWTSILARAVAPALVRHQDLPKAMEASLRKALEKSHCST